MAGAAKPRAVAMNLLARREHSTAELRDKLAARGFEPDEVDATLAALAREGLVSDARFLEAFVASHVRRGHGPARIRAELERHRLAAELIAEVLATRAAEWPALAREVRVKRFGAARPADFKERARQARFLQYRGFGSDDIRGALEDED